MRYEHICGLLMWAAEQAGLETYGMEDKLNINNLDRTFRALAVPDGWEPPFDIRAAMHFYWPCEQTAYSTIGTDGLCSLYHGDDEECSHDKAELFTELQIEYNLPDAVFRQIDGFAAMEALSQKVQTSFSDCVKHENMVAVQFEIVYYDGKLTVSSAIARHYWTIEGEHLEDYQALGGIFLGICREVHTFLERLHKDFEKTGKRKKRTR
jgi:hypothetical protein